MNSTKVAVHVVHAWSMVSHELNSGHVAAYSVFYDVWNQVCTFKSCIYSHFSLELATLTSSVDLQLMDGYVHSLFTGRVNVKYIMC